MKTNLQKIKNTWKNILLVFEEDEILFQRHGKAIEDLEKELLAFDIPFYLENAHGIVADELICKVLNHFIREEILEE